MKTTGKNSRRLRDRSKSCKVNLKVVMNIKPWRKITRIILLDVKRITKVPYIHKIMRR